tara:strand:- start:224 stop:802 length:579 start_codon:yes stop_codon:yes gene_type:complete
MEPIDVYLMYCAMKAHFSREDYDYHKYGGKTKVSRDSYWKRKDRYYFARIANKYDKPEDYFLSNFIKDKKGYIANFSDENYESWKLKRQGFFDLFAVELSPHIQGTKLNPLFKVENNQHPKLLKEYLGRRISLETLIILDELVQYTKDWDKKLGDDIVWKDLSFFLKKYKGFLTIDAERYKIKLLNLIEESS